MDEGGRQRQLSKHAASGEGRAITLTSTLHAVLTVVICFSHTTADADNAADNVFTDVNCSDVIKLLAYQSVL